MTKTEMEKELERLEHYKERWEFISRYFDMDEMYEDCKRRHAAEAEQAD